MAVVDRAHRFRAADKERCRAGAMPCLAGSLLLVELLLRAIDFAARQHLVRSRRALRELPHDHALDEIHARIETKDLVLELDLALRLVVETEEFRFHAQPSAFSGAGAADASGAAPALSGLRTEAGIGASFGRARLTASRTITQPPL